MSEVEGPSHSESIHIAAPRARVWELRNRKFFLDMGGEDELARRESNAKESIAATLQGMKAAAEGH